MSETSEDQRLSRPTQRVQVLKLHKEYVAQTIFKFAIYLSIYMFIYICMYTEKESLLYIDTWTITSRVTGGS